MSKTIQVLSISSIATVAMIALSFASFAYADDVTVITQTALPYQIHYMLEPVLAATILMVATVKREVMVVKPILRTVTLPVEMVEMVVPVELVATSAPVAH